jgi:phage terminase large subunit-like protein
LPWQKELLWKLFGTLKDNGYRQYRFCYNEIPKKNGKSELAAAVALYLLCGDEEEGAEIYSAAGDRDQAALVFNVAAQMVRNNTPLGNKLKIIDSVKRIVYFKRNSFYRVLSAEAYTKHGLNPSGIIFDELHAQPNRELHAQPNRELWDVLTEGTDIARSQQVVFVTTTAGVYDKNAIGWEVREQARQVDEGKLDDPQMLPVMYCATPEDNWEDEELWKRLNPSLKRLNPSLGYIFDIENLRTHYRQVKQNPARLNNFLRFRLNRWVNQISRWLPMDYWDGCGGEVDKGKLLKRECYGGLDLSTSPPENEKERWQILCHFYVPEEQIIQRSRRDRVQYDMWARANYITPTPGDAVDYDFIRRDVNNAAEVFDLKEVAFDPWGATKLAGELLNYDGIPMVEHRQGYKSMSPPMKELFKAVKRKELNHGNHPVLRWCADNLVVQTDAAENVKPAKDKARERIDGIVALAMALGRAIEQFDIRSKYETEGLTVL